MRRTFSVGLLLVLLATGCSQAEQAAGKAAGCASLAKDAVDARVDAPSASQLEQQARRLDDRIRSINDADVRAAVEQVRDSLRQLVDAVRAGNRSAIDRATQQFREAARRAAQVCNIPLDRFGG